MNKISYKSKKAQQLVEFALVVPILIAVLIVIIELGLALHIRMGLTEAVKVSVIHSNQLFNQDPDNSKSAKISDFEDSLLESIKDYFDNHNYPNSETIDLAIEEIPSSNNAIVKVSYKYYPAFKLPNILGGKIIPDWYEFTSSQIINSILFEPNYFTSSLSTKNLSSFGKSAGNLDPSTSLLKNSAVNGIAPEDMKKRVAFLVGFGSGYNYAKLFNWWGEDILPPNLVFKISTATLAIKSPYYSTSWLDTKIPISWVLQAHGFTQAVYAKIDSNPSIPSHRLDLASGDVYYNVGIPWCDQSGCTGCGACSDDMTGPSIDNLLKRGLSVLYDSNTSAYGSFDDVIDNSASISDNMNSYVFFKSTDINSADMEIGIKLFIPASSIDEDVYEGYSYSFPMSSGVLSTGSANTNIIDCYIDNDGDSIPNAWDLHPEYADVNANGIVDGQETSIISASDIDPYIPHGGDDTAFTIGDKFYAGATCGSTSQQIYEYEISSFSLGVDPLKIAVPFEINGSGDLAAGYIGETFNLLTQDADYKKITYIKKTYDDTNCALVDTQTISDVFYYKYNDGQDRIKRSLTGWSSANDLNAKFNFINGDTAGNLNGSFELQKLKDDSYAPFNSNQKVTNL